MTWLDDFYHEIYFYRKFTYHISFGLIVSIEFTIRALTFFVACYIFRKINEHAINETVKKEFDIKKPEPVPTLSIRMTPYYLLQRGFSFLKKVVVIIHWVVSFVGTFYLSLAAAVLNGFHVISYSTCLALTLLIYLFYFLSFILRDVPLWKTKSEDGSEIIKLPSLKRWSVVTRVAFLKHPVFYVLLALFCFVLAMVIPLMLDELCVCFFCNYGICLSSEFDRISSRMMRSFTIPDACPPGPPCHVYTTLPEDGSKSVFLNVHTSMDTEEIRVLYDTMENYNEYGRVKNRVNSMSSVFDIEAKAARYVHSSYIGNLQPNSEYYFEIHYNGVMQYSNIFKTLPSSEMERDLIIVSGGDVSANDRAQEMTNSVADLKPDVIFIDGDAAYDDGMPSCYYSYDMFLKMFEDLNEKVGYMIPLVIGVGNHDLGVNSMNEAPISRDKTGPLFFLYFPQHSSTGDFSHMVPAVPELQQRKTYFYHVIGNTLHVSLDSGYDVPFEGYQAKWLDKVSYSYSRYSKFAHYHAPLYPMCLDEQEMTSEQRDTAAQAWIPTLENHNYQGVFENHLHLLKKTYPLRKGAIHPEGVIYFGDGNWGVISHECKEKDKPLNSQIFEKIGDERHVWVMKVTKSGWEYYPLGADGKKLMEPEFKPFVY